MQGAGHPHSSQDAPEQSWPYGWGRRCSFECRLEDKGHPPARQKGSLGRALTYAWGFGAGRAAKESLQRRRGCLPGGCPRASVELPGCLSLALASLGSTTDTNGSRQAGLSHKDQTLGAWGCCQHGTGHWEPSWEWQPHRSPCLEVPLLKGCVPTWLQRGAAGRVQAGACWELPTLPPCCSDRGRGWPGPCHGERIQGVACPGFQMWGVYKPLLGCRGKWPCTSCWGLLMGMLLHPAPPQGLRPSLYPGSGGQKGRRP